MMFEAIIALENDGVNMAVHGSRLYVRCKRRMHSYEMAGLSEVAAETIFKKDGQARRIALSGDTLYLTDFCDLHMLDANDFRVKATYRIGQDLSSDLGAVRFDATHAYIGMRNGKMVALEQSTGKYRIHDICESSFWDFCIVGNHIYAGTVQGELLEIRTENMQVRRRITPGTKNIYSVLPSGEFLYTVSQDMSIKAIRIDSLEVVCHARKAVKGMARILGVLDSNVLVSDSGKVSFWSSDALRHQKSVEIPTGRYNKGIVLSENVLFGSDLENIYRMLL